MNYRRLNIFNSFVIITIAVINHFALIQRSHTSFEYFSLVIFIMSFLLISIPGIIFNSKISTALLFFIAGISTTIFNGTSDATGAMFLIFTIIIFKSNIAYYLVTLSCVIAIFAKIAFNNLNPYQAFNVFLIYAIFFIIYHFLAVQKGKS